MLIHLGLSKPQLGRCQPHFTHGMECMQDTLASSSMWTTTEQERLSWS